MTREEQLELVHAARAGDEKAFEQLLAFVEPMLRRAIFTFLLPEDVEDAVQEAMLRIHGKLHTFHEEASFSTWCVTIVKNSARMIRRKQRIGLRYVPYSIDETYEDQKGDPHRTIDMGYEDRTAEQNLARETIHTGLAQIGENERIALLMQMEGETVEVIAAALDKGISATKSILLRGKLALAEAILRPGISPKRRVRTPSADSVISSAS